MALLIGHTQVQTTLWNLYQQGKLPHAILLHGPKGIGKRLLAEQLARLLVCGGGLHNGTLSPDTSSLLHAQIEAGACADYHVLQPPEGKTKIAIDDVRRMTDKLNLLSEGNRTVILDSGDDLTIPAANALLKVLEEPPRGTYLLLIAHQLPRILPTLRSRCRKFPLDSLTPNQTQQILRYQGIQEIDEDFVQKYAGSPGEILQLGEEGIRLYKKLQKALQSKQEVYHFVDAVNQKKSAELACRLLLRQYADQARQKTDFQTATAYAKLLDDINHMDTYNLTPAWILERHLLATAG